MTLNPLFLLCFLLFVFPIAVSARPLADATSAQESQWEQQRAAYKQALQLLASGDREQFRAAAEQLRDYALYPDLKYREHLRYINQLTEQDVRAFMQAYGDSVLSLRLHQQWIQYLADKKDWKAYLQAYRPGQFSAQYDCYYYWGQYKVGNREEAFAGARKLWLVGTSQHDACNPLFGVWQTTNKIDGSLAWERMALAIDNHQLQLARHLESFLPNAEKPIAQEWRELHRDPTRLKNLNRYRAWGDKAKPLIKTGFARLIRSNRDLALLLWPQYETAFHFNDDEKAVLLGDMAFVLGANYTDNADYWLAQALQYETNRSLAPLAVRNALRKKEWTRVRSWLALIDEADQDEAEWRYWTARADRSIGPIDPAKLPRIRIDEHRVDFLSFQQRFQQALYNPQDFFLLLPESIVHRYFAYANPTATLQTLSQERHYYGFLSSELLRKPLNLNAKSMPITKKQLLEMASRPAIQRARELYLQGEIMQSRIEWHYTINRMHEEDRAVAAQLAHLWHWNHAAIIAAARSSAFDDLDIRFPTAHHASVVRHTNSAGIEPDWVYAVIRQESAFLSTARSPVGAQGLMQIMPGTARQLARDMRIAVPSPQQMLEPDINIRMGTFYLKQLLERFDGNIILATAAYNAGPHRAKAWQPRYTAMEGDIWVDTIPFKETREYVKNILTYQAIYRHHLGREVALTSALASIPAYQPDATVQR